MDVESIILISITKIIQCELCSPQEFITNEWSLPLILEVAFHRDSTRSLVVL
jgi:hypothetical protein